MTPIDLNAATPLAAWLSHLETAHGKPIDLGLERVRQVGADLDLLNPAPVVITVGGTNGKGTTCRLLETVLINAGLKVGVYSSPHLLRYNERVRIQDQVLPDAAHTASFDFIERHRRQSLSYFEFSTLSALHLFKQAALDVVILEVGLGGRLDATNIVDSDVAVITTIDIDHTDFLGDSREQIGFEKAGIFRAGKPVVIGELNIPESMIAQAEKLQCRLARRHIEWRFDVNSQDWWWESVNGLKDHDGQTPLPPKDYQQQKVRWENLPFCRIPLANAATALAALEQLPFDIPLDIIKKSLTEVSLTGRFQTVAADKLQPLAAQMGKTVAQLPQVIIDVGHNPQAANYLAEKLTALKLQKQGKILAVCGILKDKDAQGIVQPLLEIIDAWYCVSLHGYRGQSGSELQAKMQQIKVQQIKVQQIAADTQYQPATPLRTQTADSVAVGVKMAFADAQPVDIVLIFGSFHTVGEFLELIE